MRFYSTRACRVSTISVATLIASCLSAVSSASIVYTDDFSGDLGNWTASPTNLNSFSIVSGEMFLDGRGFGSNDSGWGIMQFDEELGSSFTATWEARIDTRTSSNGSAWEYSNFVLFADTPWAFQPSSGSARDGINVWVDFNDPVNPQMDALTSQNNVAADIARQVNISPDIPIGDTLSWEVSFDAGELDVSLNGTQWIDATVAEFAAANFKIGVGFGEDTDGFIDNFRVVAHHVPLPGTLALLGFGLLSLGLRRPML